MSKLPNDFVKKITKISYVTRYFNRRLAVDSNHQGKKIGAYLLIDALKRSLLMSKQIGINSVLVNAKDNTAAKFYCHFGFIELPSNELKLFLPINTVKAGLDI